MAKDHIEIDPLLNALGPLGFYPLCQCCIYFLSYLVDAYQVFSYVFTGQEVVHKCAPPTNDSEHLIFDLHTDHLDNVSVQYGTCSIDISRNVSGVTSFQSYPCLYGFAYDMPKDMSLVSEFDLVCDHEHLAALTQSLNLFGLGIGSLILPGLSDRFGRKRMMMINNLLVAVISTVAAVAPVYIVFALARFFSGFFCSGVGMTAVTAGVELFPTKHRVVTSGFWSTLFWALCIMSLAPVAYALRFFSWRAVQVAATLSAVVVIIQVVYVLDEPLRWLYANGKTKEIHKVLKKAARWNRKDFRQIVDVLNSLGDVDDKINHVSNEQKTADEAEIKLQKAVDNMSWEGHPLSNGKEVPDFGLEEGLEEVKAVKKLTFRDLFTHRRLGVYCLMSSILWCFNSMTYFALYLMSSMFVGGLYFNIFLNAAVEGASCILIMGMMDRLGRRKSLAIFQISVGISLIASSICFSYEDSHVLQICATVLSLIGKMSIGGSFNSLFLYTPEFFPTNIRNMALGITFVAATLGSVVAPFTGALTKYAVWVPGAMFGSMNFLAVICLVFLPETMGRELPQTIEDLEAMCKIPTKKEMKEKNNALLPKSRAGQQIC
ncbi:hypothetical protein C0Q70_20128 [Pomacea canaliculata]|uniref:Major facilitator superfamily (MFS) profile domain-containing protein n=1 Tax=Pomacea canaliculata TaxID=400727 RepID=A0A2T7NEN5_POMCA|nr:hypothetical protein C0Q70_20128 [Pomacea canaliculata]